MEKLSERVRAGKTESLIEEHAWLVNMRRRRTRDDILMNFAMLQSGEALFIVAGDVRAHLEGDIIEYMAVSDSVVNAVFASHASLAAELPSSSGCSCMQRTRASQLQLAVPSCHRYHRTLLYQLQAVEVLDGVEPECGAATDSENEARLTTG
ncbi:hypothetical protein FOMPIDRAFT_1052735 [Fomitopsis schrenkii]|uniref:Uncharacterized protein n=1 Tax=Fomitopsis schrenkii TaxID=2126942 RepID=S8FF53_FOMSC|nr:hypothetical protein FOMPIDRAFT_1052735 [Fomitopsis schrenkii]